MHRRLAWLGGALGGLVFAEVIGAQALPPDGLPNPSFEERVGDAPRGWARVPWAGDGELRIADAGRAGSACVQISSQAGGDLSWSCQVPVELASHYRLEGWIRTERVTPRGDAAGALLNVHNLPAARTPAVVGTQDWTPVAVEFDTGFEDSIQVNCLFGGWGLATGSAWYDDLSLTLLRKGELPAPSITIDAGEIGAPISPFIYGQFIEHLGRCIYGGIWAEMLEDRKFYYAVGQGDSPWKVIGPAENVSMSRADPFTGEHSPRVSPSNDGTRVGLQQGGLALRANRAYMGRIWLSGSAAQVSIRVVWPESESEGGEPVHAARVTWAEFARHEWWFTAPRDSDAAAIEITATGGGAFRIGAVSLMPADNVKGFRNDTLALLRELDAPVYRWPGGNFVSGYDWRDGVGERDRRPPRKNPAWQGIEHNDVGIHEFLDLCELLKTEPYIAINAGLGSLENAVAELEYVNGPANSGMGKRRAANGRAAPWNVKYWGVGNEMYGSWQLGNVPLAEYTRRHNAFVDALRKTDPAIRIIGVGAVGDWSRTMLADCADRLDYLSEHVYWQERPGLLAHVRQAPDSLRAIAEAHRAYRRELESLRGRDIRLCQDEWNYWYGPHVFGELGTRYFMKDALGCAAALHEFGRNSDLFFMANYAQTVNVIGAIKASRTAAALETTGLVLKLYRRHFGTIPCRTGVAGATIDALAAWSADRRQLTIAVVNAANSAARVPLELRGVALAGTGTRRAIAHPDPLAYNDPDGARPIEIRETRIETLGDMLPVEACSVTLFSLDVK